jgi:hypothetical protein
MLRMLKKLRRNERGNVLILTAAAAPLLLGSAGLAVDTIQWTLWKRQLQRAADSAAVAGVYDYYPERSEDSGRAAVANDLVQNRKMWMSLSAAPAVTFPGDAGTVTRQVRVALSVQQSLPFSSIFMPTAPLISARATAALVPAGGTACFQALATGSVTGIRNNGNATVIAPRCIGYSNSSSVNSASAGGSSDIRLRAIATVGGVSQSSNWSVGSYLPYSPILPDQYKDINPEPAEMECTAAPLTESTNFAALATGTNCFSSLSVQPNQTLNLDGKISGPIYINGGDVDLKGTITCSGCTIILTNQDPSPTATIGTYSTNAQALNNISAPADGDYAGIAIFQDRRASAQTITINGGSGSLINGAVYFPKALIRLNGNGSSDSMCARFIAQQIEFIGNGGVTISDPDSAACRAFGGEEPPPILVVRLVA